MSRRLALLVGIALLGGVAVGLLLARKPSSEPAPRADAAPSAVALAVPVPAETPATQEQPPANISAAPVLWQAVDPAQVDPADTPTHREVVPGRVLVRLAVGFGHWNAGDSLALAIPQDDAVFNAAIEEVHRGPGGARAFTGTLAAADAAHNFVLTVGRASTFANITTPVGRYELVGNRRYAWLMPVANMDRDVDYAVPDYHPRHNAPPEAPTGPTGPTR